MALRTAALVLGMVAVAAAFAPAAVPRSAAPASAASSTRLHAYVPEGLSAEQYKNIKAKEKVKNGGRTGPRGFQSRSMTAFQEALERGETGHLMPVNPDDIKSGKVKAKDVPYMQRGGNWDGSDLKGKDRAGGGFMKKTKRDMDYEMLGSQEKTSVSIFGGGNMPWTGKEKFGNPLKDKNANKKNFAVSKDKKGMYDPAYNANGAKQRQWGRPTVAEAPAKKTWGSKASENKLPKEKKKNIFGF